MTAENSGIDYDIIKMSTGDTALVPDGVAAVGQRQTFITGNATLGASWIFKQRILEIVAQEFGVDSSVLDLQGREVVNRKSRDEVITLKGLAELMSKRKETIASEYNYGGLPQPIL
jgi:CO/xanthine dehydrogenase Mo-binding subunit